MTDATLLFLTDLFLLLAGAVVAGEVAAHFGQPPLVGQLLVGILFGPSLLGPYVGLSTLGPDLSGLQVLATVFVLFVAGLELTPEDLVRMSSQEFLFGVMLFVVPLLGASGAVYLLFPGSAVSFVLLIGVTLAATALPVLLLMLQEFGLFDAPLGRTLISAALVNEFAAIAMFAVLLNVGSGGGLFSFLLAVAAVGFFLGVMFGIHSLLKYLREQRRWSPLVRWFRETWRSKQGAFALLMVLLLASTLFAEAIGVTYVIGAFFAGLLVTRESAGSRAHRSISQVFDYMTWGFFIPLFFAFAGVQMDLHDLGSSPVALSFLLLLVVASATKIGVGLAFSPSLGWRAPDGLAASFLANSRGGVQLAFAVILLDSGTISGELFTVIAAVGLVTSILAPIGALWAWRRDPRSRQELYDRVPSLRPATGRGRWFPVGSIIPWTEDSYRLPENEPATAPEKPRRGTPPPR